MRRLSAAQKTEYVKNKNYILKKRDIIAIIRNGVTLFVISMKANDKNSHCQSFFTLGIPKVTFGAQNI